MRYRGPQPQLGTGATVRGHLGLLDLFGQDVAESLATNQMLCRSKPCIKGHQPTRYASEEEKSFQLLSLGKALA